MIVSALLKIFYGFASLLISLLPNADSSWAGNLTTAMNWFGNFLAHISYVAPIFTTFFSILSLTILIEGGIFMFKILNWIYNKLRGSG